MKTLKKACAVGFGRIAGWAFQHHWLALLLVAGIVASLVAQLPKLTMDTSNESFFHHDDQVLLDYNAFRDQYGKDEFIIITVDNPNIFSLDFLGKLREFHHQLQEKVPYIDKITSLLNVRNTHGEGDEIVVSDFIKPWPQNAQDLETLKRRAGENSLYKNFVLSEDGKTTAIIIKPLACNPRADTLLQNEGSCQPMTNDQNRAMMAAIEKVVATFRADDFPIAMSGMPVVVDYLNFTLEKDLSIIIPAMYIMVIVFLWLMFRRITGTVYPVLLFMLSLLSTVGLMAVLGIPMTNITIILPSFMLVVGISDAVHILALFYPEYQKCGDKKKAIVAAMEHSGLAVLMTSATTAGGLLSFVAAKIAPISDLGLVAPIGVCLALFYTVLLLPALLAIFPVKQKEPGGQSENLLDRGFRGLASFTSVHSWKIVGVFALFALIALSGASQLHFSHLALRWFPKDAPIRLDTEKIDRVMHGTVSLDIIIDTGRPDGLYDADFIARLQDAAARYGAYQYKDLFVGKVLDLTTVLKETNRALHENRQAEYQIPKSKKLIAQELFLFQLSGSDDLEEMVDQQFSQTRLALHLPYRDSSKFRKFVKFVDADLRKTFPEATVTVTGVNALFIEILNNVMVTMARSYGIALVLISVLMIFMLGRLRMGLISMLPNIFPLVAVLGLMGWFDIPLDFGTILVGSISIGIIVDDTIHFLHNFSRYYAESKDPKSATLRTLKTAGRAMLATSVVLMGGFLCNLFSGLTLNQYTGFLIAATIFIALVSDFLLTPALLSIVYGKKIQATNSLEVSV
ncbi:MAG: efflux RND transporter permease subunit [Pseudomonadota bacterium]